MFCAEISRAFMLWFTILLLSPQNGCNPFCTTSVRKANGVGHPRSFLVLPPQRSQSRFGIPLIIGEAIRGCWKLEMTLPAGILEIKDLPPPLWPPTASLWWKGFHPSQRIFVGGGDQKCFVLDTIAKADGMHLQINGIDLQWGLDLRT